MTTGRGLSAGRLSATCGLFVPLIMVSGRKKVTTASALPLR